MATSAGGLAGECGGGLRRWPQSPLRRIVEVEVTVADTWDQGGHERTRAGDGSVLGCGGSAGSLKSRTKPDTRGQERARAGDGSVRFCPSRTHLWLKFGLSSV